LPSCMMLTLMEHQYSGKLGKLANGTVSVHA
jgi:hypothetical protein